MLKDFSVYKVLIVDDIPANVWLLKVMLENSGLQVFTAESAEEALIQLKKEKIDIILLDVLMPGVDGFELANQLKNDANYKEIRIIFLTALTATSDVVKGFHQGGDDFISKPFNKEELLIRIRYQLSLLEAKRIIQRQKTELEDTIAGRDMLYSVIAHDIRTPMSSLKMILNILTLKMNDHQLVEPEIVEMVQSANEISEQSFILLDNLLKWTRSQLGKLEAVPQIINLSELVGGVIEVYSMIAATKEIKINFDSSLTENADVFVDVDMIKTSIRNLLGNAIKYSYRGSEIEVTVSLKEKDVIFSVVDHGCGITEEDQCKLLDLATHCTSYGTENEPGSGLGLFLVNEFLKLNHGRLLFRSKAGEGSTFGFALPVKEVQD